MHGLKIVVLPAAAALVWFFKNLNARRDSHTDASEAPTEPHLEGEDVQVELPSGRGPQLPFSPPPPLKNVLLDVTLPMSLAALWLALFHNSSSLMTEFHEELGDREVRLAPWRRHKDDKRRRVMHYITPLRNPLGPRQAINIEALEAGQLTASGFVLRARCDSEGVPFAACFANHIQWVALPVGAHSCRLLVTGECRFHSPVWGPLKGRIESESIKGMSRAYGILLRMLEQRYGGVKAVQPGTSGSTSRAASFTNSKQGRAHVAVGADATTAGSGTAAGDAAQQSARANIAALLASPQTNAAAFLAIVVVMMLVWRLAFMQPMLLQAVRNMAAAAAARPH